MRKLTQVHWEAVFVARIIPRGTITAVYMVANGVLHRLTSSRHIYVWMIRLPDNEDGETYSVTPKHRRSHH